MMCVFCDAGRLCPFHGSRPAYVPQTNQTKPKTANGGTNMKSTMNTALTEQLGQLAADFTQAAIDAPTLDGEAENHYRAAQTRLVTSMTTEYPSTTTELGRSWLEAGRRLLHAEAAAHDAALHFDAADDARRTA